MINRIVVDPTGDPNSRQWILAEAPGKTEHKAQLDYNRGRRKEKGCVLLGAAGQTLDTWLEKVGLPRKNWHVLNTVKHWPNFLGDRANEKPTAEEVAEDLPALLEAIETYQPRVIVAAGNVALEAVLAGTEHLDFSMEILNGRPCQSKLGPIIIPIVHPAAGLHDSHQAVQTYLGLRAAVKFITEDHTLETWFGNKPPTEYRILSGAAAVKAACLDHSGAVNGTPVDTEGYPNDPWCLQFSTGDGKSYLIWARDKAALQAFYKYARRPFIFHNVLYDLDMMEAMGIPLKDDEYACTLVKTYVTAREMASGKADTDEASVRGQGLKSLTYKYLGHRMTPWPELIKPAQDKMARRYLSNVWEQTLGPERPIVTHEGDGEGCIQIGDSGRWANPYPIIKASKKLGIKGCTAAQSRKRYREHVLAYGQQYLPSLIGQILWCRCDGRACPATVLADLVVDLPGPCDPPTIGKEHKLSRRLPTLLTGPDVYKKWSALTKEKPEWNNYIGGRFGPLPSLSYRDIEPAKFLDYACSDPLYGGYLDNVQSAEMTRADVWEPYNIDMAVIPMLRAMTKTGIYVDKERLRLLEIDAQGESDKLYRRLRLIAFKAGMRDFNPDSSDDIAVLIFDKFRVPIGRTRRTKTGRPTVDEKGLSSLPMYGPHAEFRELLLDYKEVQKLLSTYVRPLWGFIAADGRLHPQWRATVTVSGRLAASDPNLLAFPARPGLSAWSKKWRWGARLRACFVPMPGNVFLSLDLSQIELRVLASESGDEAMIHAYRNNIDLHKQTVQNDLGFDPESDEGKARRVHAKTVSFGVCYGLMAQGLQSRFATMGISMSVEECQDLIDKKKAGWPQAFAYLDAAADEAREFGYVKDMWGRMRYLPLIWSPVEWARAEAARMAGNLKIQGGATGVAKKGMKAAWDRRHEIPKWNPFVMIHDSTEYEGPEDEVEKATAVIKECFETAAQDRFIIPIIAESKWGKDWGAMH